MAQLWKTEHDNVYHLHKHRSLKPITGQTTPVNPPISSIGIEHLSLQELRELEAKLDARAAELSTAIRSTIKLMDKQIWTGDTLLSQALVRYKTELQVLNRTLANITIKKHGG